MTPRWQPVYPVGFPAAVDSMGSIAAPLLASVAAGVIVFASTDRNSFRWPDLTLALLLGGLIALIATVQFSFRARSYAVTPNQIEEWWPGKNEETLQYRRRVQMHHYIEFFRWANRARWSYNSGVLLLAAAFATITMPKHSLCHAGYGEQVVFLVACVGFVAQAAWLVLSFARQKWDPGVVLPEVEPETSISESNSPTDG